MEMAKKIPVSIPAISIARSILGRDLAESLFSLFLCTVGDLFTGIAMGIFTGYLEMLPALLILIPPTIGMRGNIFASLGSRLGTYLHTGEISPSFKMNPLLTQNIYSSMALTGISGILLGFLSTLVSHLLGMKASIYDMVLISIIAGILSAIVMLLFTFIIAFLSFRKGWDPDNTTAPLITLIGDMVTLPFLFLSFLVIQGLPILVKQSLFIASLLTILIVPAIYPRKEREVYARIMRESLPILSVCGILGTVSGFVLTTRIEGFISVPGLLILIPPFLEDGGAIGSILASRLSSALHLGHLEYEKFASRSVLRLFALSHTLSIFVFSLVAVFGYASAFLLGIRTLPFPCILLASVMAGELLTLIVNLVTYYVAIRSFKIGMDPDNVTIPIITSTVDLMGSMCFVGILVLLGMV